MPKHHQNVLLRRWRKMTKRHEIEVDRWWDDSRTLTREDMKRTYNDMLKKQMQEREAELQFQKKYVWENYNV